MSNQRLEKLLEMIEKQPDDLFLQYALGMEYMGKNDADSAERLMRKVIETDKQYVPAYYQLAKLLVNRHLEEEAITYLELGLEEAKKKGDSKTINEFRSFLDELLY